MLIKCRALVSTTISNLKTKREKHRHLQAKQTKDNIRETQRERYDNLMSTVRKIILQRQTVDRAANHPGFAWTVLESALSVQCPGLIPNCPGTSCKFLICMHVYMNFTHTGPTSLLGYWKLINVFFLKLILILYVPPVF